MRRGVVLGCFCLFLGAVAFGEGPAAVRSEEYPRWVSLLDLIIRGDEFDGKRVRVAGAMSVEPGGECLCLTKEHARLYVSAFCVGLALYEAAIYDDEEDLFDQQIELLGGSELEYVRVRATYSTKGPQMAGHLHSVERISFIEDRLGVPGTSRPPWRPPKVKSKGD